MVIPILKFSKMGEGGLSGLQFQKGAFWKIWNKIYCSARNLLVHHSSLSHTTYVETNEVTFPCSLAVVCMNLSTPFCLRRHHFRVSLIQCEYTLRRLHNVRQGRERICLIERKVLGRSSPDQHHYFHDRYVCTGSSQK